MSVLIAKTIKETYLKYFQYILRGRASVQDKTKLRKENPYNLLVRM